MMTNDTVPTLSADEIRAQSDLHLLNGVSFAMANAGLERVNELARLLGVREAEENVLEAAQNIVNVFSEMHVEMDLTENNTFTCKITFNTKFEEGGFFVNHTLQ